LTDLLIRGGDLVDVDAGVVRPGCSVAISQGRVVSVGAELEAERTVDARGLLVLPGLIEPHFHLSRIGLPETARLQVAAGVTTTVLETSELSYTLGPAAVLEILRQARLSPGRVFVTLPPLFGADAWHEARVAPAREWLALFDEQGVVGVGECYWAELLRGNPRAEALVRAAVARGLAVEGHAAGAKRHHLEALMELGVGADHEAITAGETAERLRLGLYAYAREGITRQDLDAIAPVWREGLAPLDRLAFCSDGLDVGALCAGESLNTVVAKAVREGLPLPAAVRAATLVPARRFGLAPSLGTLAVGAHADLLLVADRELMRPELVLVGGEEPRPPAAVEVPPAMLDTVHPRAFGESLLRGPGPGRWRAMRLYPEAPMVTREVESDGSEALVAVAVDRLGEPRAFRGLLAGFGLRSASVATTAGSESRVVLLVGVEPADLRLALEEVTRMRGGAAVVRDGEVVARWAAPFAGMFSLDPCEKVAREVAAVNQALRDDGCPLPDPLLTLEFITSPAIPHLRLGADGYYRLRDGARPPLEWA
jgi:adenine deaminase